MTAIACIAVAFGALWAWLYALPNRVSCWRKPGRTPPVRHFRRKRPTPVPTCRHARKPLWIHNAVIDLAARRHHASCRQVADDFNRLYAHTGWRVGKTFTATALQHHRLRILRQRQSWKNRQPKPAPCHHTWALDLTFVQGTPVIGILDHGSRHALALRPLADKSSLRLLRALLDAIEAVGAVPRHLRTDNEACFCSRLFRFGLWLLRIRHQRTQLASPWQNGRVERFFGTLKEKLRHVVIEQGTLEANLDRFRFWYNHVRTHRNLDGRTPHEVLTGAMPAAWLAT